PPNVIGRIGNFVATGNTPLEAATNGVLWSRVCVYTHVSFHQYGQAQRVQQALENDALLKIWGRLSRQLNFNENPRPQTLAEIKAWFDDPANAEQLNAIRELNLENLGLKAIPPEITRCTQLVNLYLSNNRITDISALRQLAQLQHLYLSNNQITDIPALESLTQLGTLYLSINRITDISALRKLALLQYLSLSYNEITDISALESLTQLGTLYLSNNRISDISALGNLSGLIKLFLDNNRIADVSALGNLTQLSWLHLPHNQITDISPIGNLSQLSMLHLGNNQITDISGLANKEDLTTISIVENPLLFIYEKDAERTPQDIKELKKFLKKQDAFNSYPSESNLSKFIQFIAQPNIEHEQMEQKFAELDQQDKNLICEMVYELSGSESTDPQWREHHVFDDRAVFYYAIRRAISAKFEGLSQNEKNIVYGHIYELSGRPATQDPKWGKRHAFENVLRLVDAMNRAANACKPAN
ncbi:MAG: leucine-rich repeat domain-containing protein, partial [Verrucomicrobia bacterium]|nr:leucine-rich repeat domain-containing protein [Verrucomicrobiota bacterium]